MKFGLVVAMFPNLVANDYKSHVVVNGLVTFWLILLVSHAHTIVVLLRKQWLRDAKVSHDWGNNIMTIQGNGVVRIVMVTKHLGTYVKQPKMLLCYNYQNGITDEKENIIFATKL